MKLTNQQKEKLKGAKILITGGAGFIGSNLCEFFLKCYSDVFR
jgi:nucleoside-diphosphate-sugar epimerase